MKIVMIKVVVIVEYVTFQINSTKQKMKMNDGLILE